MIEYMPGVVFLLLTIYAVLFKIKDKRVHVQTIWMGVAFVSLALAIAVLWSPKYTGIIFILGIFNIGYGIYLFLKSR